VTEKALSCEDVLDHLFAYLDGELDAATGEDIERHLHACRGCFSRAEFERRLKVRLAEANATGAPETLVRRIRTLMEQF
jgi:anti-sigma factor (TIGR02949 family)